MASATSNKDDLYATYSKQKRNLNEAAQNVISTIGSEDNNKSNLVFSQYNNTQSASALQKFLQKLRIFSKAKKGEPNNLVQIATDNGFYEFFLSTENNDDIQNLLSHLSGINFSAAGEKFESEFAKLFKDQQKVLAGRKAAGVYVNAENFENAIIEQVNDQLTNSYSKLLNKAKRKQTSDKQQYINVVLSGDRSQKIDINKGQIKQIGNVKLSEKGITIKNILQNSTFSLKSYKQTTITSHGVSYGKSNMNKAVSGVIQYVDSKTNSNYSYLYTFFISHNGKSGYNDFIHLYNGQKYHAGTAAGAEELHKKFKIMKSYFQLTGMGLRTTTDAGILDQMSSVDFLIVNAYQGKGGTIKVYSTKALLQKIYSNFNKKYKQEGTST